jgi:hypothetical protein
LEYSRDDIKLNPFQHLLKIKTWGIKWKRVIDKIDEWAAWLWANAKIDKENIELLKQIVHMFKEIVEDYNLAMFTHDMDFFKQCANLKKPTPKHFLTSFLSDFDAPPNSWKYSNASPKMKIEEEKGVGAHSPTCNKPNVRRG